MKLYETGRLLLEPLLPPLYQQIRARLTELVKNNSKLPSILDVGSRRSNYTIGLRAKITLFDLPRQTEIQRKLNLGIDENVLQEINKRRSNVEKVILGDMTNSNLPNDSFDIAVAIEVLEHVEEDEKFVSEIFRVLKPGGIFLMSTPNGDWVVNKNPDHKRHYQKNQLNEILKKYFDKVSIDYAIYGGKFRSMGLKSWSLKNPIKTLRSIVGNIVNAQQSSRKEIKYMPAKTHHLIAIACKKTEMELIECAE